MNELHLTEAQIEFWREKYWPHLDRKYGRLCVLHCVKRWLSGEITTDHHTAWSTTAR